MSLTITLPEPLTTLLEQRAEQMHIPIDDLAVRLLSDALTINGTYSHKSGIRPAISTLEMIVAEIRATPLNINAIEYGEKFGDTAYLDSLLVNPPKGTMTFSEWEEEWPHIEAYLKTLDSMPLLPELLS